ncbi:hypothetical protein V7S43_011512 [Phytophthora oleae]|uniref:Uncharacterized protein n=1 Tax=Phytophthora oleae TaxID=2107226 RepID=A0ABD3FD38_9STRA
MAEVHELFDPFQYDDESQQEHLETSTPRRSPAQTAQGSAKRPRETTVCPDDGTHEWKPQRSVLDQDVLIIKKLRENPDLLDRFLSIRQGLNNGDHISSTAQQTPLSQRKRTVVAPVNTPSGASEYAFVPQED